MFQLMYMGLAQHFRNMYLILLNRFIIHNLFLYTVMYDNEYKTKANKNWTKDKIEPQHIQICNSN